MQNQGYVNGYRQKEGGVIRLVFFYWGGGGGGGRCFQKGIISLSIDFMPLKCNFAYVWIVLVDTKDTVPQSFRNVG